MGTFGDKEVRVASCLPKDPNGVQIVLLHGVHSSANMGENNKFRLLSKLLSERGYTPWLVETSRKIRNRQDFSNDVSRWINKAFSGKTYVQEQQDVFTAICNISTASKGKPLWLWGFSLGGIIALSAAAKSINCCKAERSLIPERVIVSGTGLVAFKDVEERMMSLPILSTLRKEIAPDMFSHVNAKRLISFRGSCDEIFSEESCFRLLKDAGLPEEDKQFFTIEGADHSFRTRYGKADPEIMKEMVSQIAKTWS